MENITIVICLALFILIAVLRNVWFGKIPALNFKKRRLLDFCFVIAGAVIISPIFVIMHIQHEKFLKKEIKGHILYIDTTRSRGTSFFVGQDSEKIVLAFKAGGISVNDSFYKPVNSDKTKYHYFKKDSLGVYKEIEWGAPHHGERKWKFKH
jgi:hypothetical protein